MNGQTFHFDRISIHRMPGFQNRGFEIKDLCAGVNIVYGPNASGKSTTARTIESLLWPRDAAPHRASIAGSATIAGESWRIEFDTGSLRCQRDGADAELPPLLPATGRDRYRLALHELIIGDNADFADAVLRESSGGYDVHDAVAKLGFRPNASRAKNEEEAVRGVREKIAEVETRQRELSAEEVELADLEGRKAEATAAHQRGRTLENMIGHRKLQARRNDLQKRLEGFPEGIAKLRGDELDTLTNIRNEREAAMLKLSHEKQRDHDVRNELAACGLSEPVPPTLLATLQERSRKMEQLESRIREFERDISPAEDRRDDARRCIGSAVSDGKLRKLCLGDYDKVAEFARAAEDTRSKIKAGNALSVLIGEIERPSNLQNLSNGIWLLNRWLTEPNHHTDSTPKIEFWIGKANQIVLILLGIILAIFIAIPWVMIAVIGIVLMVISFLKAHKADRRSSRQADYERLKLEQPEQWTPESVDELVTKLNDTFAEARFTERKAERLDELAIQRRELEMRQAELELRREELIQRFGVASTFDESALYLLATNIIQWQEADAEVRRIVSKRDVTAEQCESLLTDINESLENFEANRAADSEETAAIIQDLAKRNDKLLNAENELKRVDRSLSEIGEQAAGLDRRYENVFNPLGLPSGDEQILQQWLDQFDDYQDASQKLDRAEHDVRNAESRVANAEDWQDQPIEALEQECNDCRAKVEELEELNTTIGDIRGRIRDARKGHELEDGLADKTRCEEALRDVREVDFAAATGWLLAEHVDVETRDRERPRVFHRAREILARFTQDRYRLDLANGELSAFRAFDTMTGVGHALDELSSGSRIQLLMAVRLAFVEECEQEVGIRLPLILDEILANSDEQRALAIIEATIEICRSGRQVFYFTAQSDEVGKWISLLQQQSDVPWKTIDLAAARGFAESERLPFPEVSPLPPSAIPEPGAASHEDYGRTLNVSGFDLVSGRIGSLHVWYLIDDNQTVFQLVRAGIHRWGQLRNLMDRGATALLGADSESIYERALAAEHVVQCLADNWRIGRGIPVDRAAIADSNAVSKQFMDVVSALNAELDGNAAAVIRGLREKKVKNFRSIFLEKLRDYFLEHGHLDERPMLSSEQLREHALIAADADLKAGRITVEKIDELIGRLIVPQAAA